MIRMVPALMFMLLCGALLMVLMQMEKPRTPTQGPLVDLAMPTLPLINAASADAPLTPTDYKGRVTVVNFFASWCGPCAFEMAELVKLHQDDPKARFIGVAWNDGPATIDGWLKKNGNPFTEVRYDANGRSAIAMGLRGIPESFLIDGKGIIRYQVAGTVTEDMRLQALDPLLKQMERELHAH